MSTCQETQWYLNDVNSVRRLIHQCNGDLTPYEYEVLDIRALLHEFAERYQLNDFNVILVKGDPLSIDLPVRKYTITFVLNGLTKSIILTRDHIPWEDSYLMLFLTSD